MYIRSVMIKKLCKDSSNKPGQTIKENYELGRKTINIYIDISTKY